MWAGIGRRGCQFRAGSRCRRRTLGPLIAGLDRGDGARRRVEAVEPGPVQVDANERPQRLSSHCGVRSGISQPMAISSRRASLTRRRATPKASAIHEALTRPRAEHLPCLEIEAAEEVAEDGGDQGGTGAAGQEPEDAARDRQRAGDGWGCGRGIARSRPVGQGDGLGRGREGDGGLRPGQQSGRLEPAEGFPEPPWRQPGEPLELVKREAAGQGGGPRQRRARISQAANQTRRSASRMSCWR